MSNRKKKQKISEGVRKLRSRPGWDTRSYEGTDPMEKLFALEQKERNDSLFGENPTCPECEKLREASQDPTALCQDHLAEAMGF